MYLKSIISAKNPQTTNMDLPGYNIRKQTPTESSIGGALIFIS